MYVCMYVCMYLHVYMYVHICMHVSMYVYMYVNAIKNNLYINACMHWLINTLLTPDRVHFTHLNDCSLLHKICRTKINYASADY